MRTMLKVLPLSVIALSLTGCFSGSDKAEFVSTPVIPTPSTLAISGEVVKGTLANATVEAFAAADLDFANVLATTQTDANGDYTLTITDTSGAAIVGSFFVRISADDDTTMICDAAACGDVARGEAIPAASLTGLSLSTITNSTGTGTIASANANALTSLATDALVSAARASTANDLSNPTSLAEAQKAASKIVAAILGVDAGETNLFDVAIVDASDSAAVSTDALSATLNLINASLSGLTVADGETLGGAIANYVDAVDDITAALIADPEADLGAE